MKTLETRVSEYHAMLCKASNRRANAKTLWREMRYHRLCIRLRRRMWRELFGWNGVDVN